MEQINYIELISIYYPNVGCHVKGDPNIYENIVHDSGDAIPDKATLDGLRLSAIRNKLWEEIKQYRDTRKFKGIYVSNKWFHNDPDSRSQWLGLKDKARDVLANGGNASTILTINHPTMGITNITWNTMDGTFIPVTVQLAFDVVEKTGDLDGTLHGTALYHRQNINASSTPESYNYKLGWLPIYGE